MRGRKLSHNVRSKQKLVIERPQAHECQCLPPSLPKRNSAFKLLQNKQNQKEGLRPIEHYSLEKKIKPEELNVRALHIHRASVVSTDFRKRESISKFNQQHSEPADKRLIHDHIQSLLNRLENKSQHSDSSLQALPAPKLRRILTFILEEHFGSIKKLQELQHRINFLQQLAQLPSHISENEFSDTHDMKNSNHTKMSFRRVLDQKIYPFQGDIVNTSTDDKTSPNQQVELTIDQKIKRLSFDSNIFFYKSLVEEKTQEGEQQQLVLDHLSQLNNYILNQPNKILHQAFRRHRFLEQELFAYADLLSISHMGAKTYTLEANIPQIQKNIESSLRYTNRQIIQGDYPIEQKCRMLRDFALKVQQCYRPILDQLIRVIDKKTEYSRTFVFKVLKWQQNYITRKEFLISLKTDYSTAIVRISRNIALLQAETCSRSAAKGLAIEIQENMAIINNAFMLGNSFY